MQLKSKIAVIYGASGAIGSAIASAFAAEGALVFLTARNMLIIEALAKEIIDKGGYAEAHQVDALDADSVKEHLEMIIANHGRLDIAFNGVGILQKGVQGLPLLEMNATQYMHPVSAYSTANFITATAAAREMVKNKSGVILTLTAVPSVLAAPLTGGMAASWAGIESLTRTLASETGGYGVRVVCLRSDGIPETNTITTVFGEHAKGAGMSSHKDFQQLMEQFTLLKRLPTLKEITDTAVFLASDKASAITGTTINITCGSVVD